jgi:hypothetical protein
VIERVQRVQPVLVIRQIGHPEFVEPADAGPASSLPFLDRIDIQEIPVVLAHCDEQIVILSQSHGFETRIQEYEFSGNVPIEESTLPAYSKLEACKGAWLETYEIDVVDFGEHVLSLVQTTLKGPPREPPGGGHQDAWLGWRILA